MAEHDFYSALREVFPEKQEAEVLRKPHELAVGLRYTTKNQIYEGHVNLEVESAL